MKNVIISAAVLLILAGCTTGNSQALPIGNEKNLPAIDPVATTPITVEEENPLLSADAISGSSLFNGTLMLPPQSQATVSLIRGGTIRSVNRLPGELVQKGTLLATVENPEFIELQQEYLEATARIEYLEAEYKRQERLSQQEAASQKKSQESKADYFSMKSRLEASQAQLKLLGFNPEIIRREGIQPYLEIRSPLSGYLADIQVNTGKYMEAGEAICQVIDKSRMLLAVTVYEKDIRTFTTGDKVNFRISGLPGKEFRATVFSIGQQIDDNSRSFPVYAQVEGSDPLFRPGMYVSVAIGNK